MRVRVLLVVLLWVRVLLVALLSVRPGCTPLSVRGLPGLLGIPRLSVGLLSIGLRRLLRLGIPGLLPRHIPRLLRRVGILG